MDNNREDLLGGVNMARYYDRDTKLACVYQINSGKMTVTEVVDELRCSKSTICSWIRKLSEN